MVEETDLAAVKQVREGDVNAFRVLVDRHSRALFELAYRMTGQEQDAEDIVQSTFVRAFRHLDGFDARSSFATWLHRIAINCALSLLHQRRPRTKAAQPVSHVSLDALTVLPAATPAPDCAVIQAEVEHEVWRALDQLTPGERTAFVLRHFENKSMEEIGAVLGSGANNAKQSVFRAVQKMRRALAPVLAMPK